MILPERVSSREATSDLDRVEDHGNWSPTVAVQKLQGAVKGGQGGVNKPAEQHDSHKMCVEREV